jgi:8-oxo-dGTP pyrophosphatase MutT (NUDIX family)
MRCQYRHPHVRGRRRLCTACLGAGFAALTQGQHKLKKHQGDPPTSILAAGGILKGEGVNEGKIVIVRRRRYGGEIALPKGKVKGKEGVLAAALREVKEETGYDVEIVEYAGTTHYRVGERPKAVSYFIMRVPDSSQRRSIDGEEIEAVEWMTPNDAKVALTHVEDRNLIAAVFGLPRD